MVPINDKLQIDQDKTRQQVWVAMSILFLDTELSAEDLMGLADILHRSPYQIDELISIYEDEVAPVLYTNLLSVVGVWGAFDEAEVTDLITKRLRGLEGKKHIKGVGPFAWIRRWYMLSQSEPEWQIVLTHLENKRKQS